MSSNGDGTFRGGHDAFVFEQSYSVAGNVSLVLSAVSDILCVGTDDDELWIYVVKLPRAHGGCLGIRRL